MCSPARNAVWVIAPDPGVLLRHWGNSYVAYNVASGDTHQLGALAGSIVEHLRARNMTRFELSEMLDSDEAANDAQFCEILESTLTDLANLGLITVRQV